MIRNGIEMTLNHSGMKVTYLKLVEKPKLMVYYPYIISSRTRETI